jgi:uncharacterized protein (DUF486 family)
MFSNPFITIILLVISNTFMTLAWYGHLKYGNFSIFQKYGLFSIIIFSWILALFEYIFQVPANKYGFIENGGKFNLWQLKIIQEAISIGVFVCFTLFFFKNESIRWNHVVGFFFLLLSVFFIFKK